MSPGLQKKKKQNKTKISHKPQSSFMLVAFRKKVKVGSYSLFSAVCCPVKELSYLRKRFYHY